MRALTHLAGAFWRLSRFVFGAMLLMNLLASPAHGFFSGSRVGKIVQSRPQTPVPELSPGALGGGFIVLCLGVLLLTDRRRAALTAAQDTV